jgi:transcriptional regulator with XRE-family HTH domain
MDEAKHGHDDDWDAQQAAFAAQFSELIARSGLSLRDLARMTRYGRSTISDARKNKTFPRRDLVVAIAKVCGAPEAEWSQRWERVNLGRIAQQRAPSNGQRQPVARREPVTTKLPPRSGFLVARATELTALGNVLCALGEAVLARERLERALGILEEIYGPEHPEPARRISSNSVDEPVV